MKKRIKYFIGILIILIFLLAALYWYFNPVNHFKADNIPVLVTPEITQEISEIELYKKIEIMDKVQEKTEVKKEEEMDSFNVLILGIDSREGENSRTDVIMLANVNPKKKQLNIISIPRDTRIKVNGIGYTKINHTHLLGEIKGGNHSGTEAVFQAVSNFFQVPIHYYVKTNFEGFRHFVDTIGGIDVELSQPVTLTFSKITLPAKEQHLDGDLALKLVRERYSLSNGDFGRQKNQLLVLKAIARKVLAVKNIDKIPEIIRQVSEDIIDTNFTDSDIISLALMFKGMSEENINYIQIPGHEDYALDPLINKKLYYWFPDFEEIDKITQRFLSD